MSLIFIFTTSLNFDRVTSRHTNAAKKGASKVSRYGTVAKAVQFRNFAMKLNFILKFRQPIDLGQHAIECQNIRFCVLWQWSSCTK